MKLLEPLVTSNLWETKKMSNSLCCSIGLPCLGPSSLSDSEKVKGCVDLCSSDGVK